MEKIDRRTTENSAKMGTEPVARLLLKLSVPSILAALVNNLYNVVDSIFVAQLNEKALSALSLSAPVQILMAALGAGMAAGLNAVISRALGEKNRTAIQKAAAAGIFLAGCSYLFILLMQIFLLKPFFAWQTNDLEILRYGEEYLTICMVFSFGCMIQWVFDRFLIAAGRTGCFMVSLATASIVNLILDPILIFGYLGFPALGIAGAAYATVAGQILGAVVSVAINLLQNQEIPIQCTISPEKEAVLQILRVGVPTTLMQGMVSVAGMLVNLVLIGFSSTAVAVYGICVKVQNMFLVVPHGINLALIPIVAYNAGAGKPERQKEAFRWALIDSLVFLGAGVLALEIAPQTVLRLFHASENMLAIGTPALRILALAMLLSVYGFVLGAVLQALGKGVASMVLTVARQVVFPLPLLMILGRTGRLTVVWLAFLAAEAAGLLFSIYLHREKYALFQTTSLNASRNLVAAFGKN